jgi:hypothetical protein
VGISVKKKLKVKKLSNLREFELNLLDYFEFNGQGIDIGYPVNSLVRNRQVYFLKADTILEGFDKTHIKGNINYIGRVSSTNNLYQVKFGLLNNKIAERVIIYDGFNFKRTLVESSVPIKNIKVFEFPLEEGEQETKFCAIF